MHLLLPLRGQTNPLATVVSLSSVLCCRFVDILFRRSESQLVDYRTEGRLDGLIRRDGLQRAGDERADISLRSPVASGDIYRTLVDLIQPRCFFVIGFPAAVTRHDTRGATRVADRQTADAERH